MPEKGGHAVMGYVFALGATALWSGNFIVARGVSEAIPPGSLAFCRWLTAVVVFAPFALQGAVREWPLVRRHLGYVAVTAFLGVTCFNTFIYIAGHTTTAMNLSLIAITFPVFIILISAVLFNERLTIQKGVGIGLVLVGVVCLITRGQVGALLGIRFAVGDLWMLAAAVIFAVFSILLKQKPEGISVFTMQFSSFVLGLLFLSPFFCWEQVNGAGNYLNRTTIPAILYIGIFASLCAFLCWNRAIQILGPSRAGMVYYTLPLFCGLLAHLFLGESVGWIHLFSLVMILWGIVMVNRAETPVRREDRERG